MVESAASALRELIEDPDTPKGVRLKAALAVLNTVGVAAKQAAGEDDIYYLDKAKKAAPEATAPAPQPAPEAVVEAASEALPAGPFRPAAPCPCGSGQLHASCCGPFFELPMPRAA